MWTCPFRPTTTCFAEEAGSTLEPIPASAGNWVFKDNLFDKVNFFKTSTRRWTSTTTPIGRYLLETTMGFELPVRLGPGPAPTRAGSCQRPRGGGNEQVLASAPPYQTGPLGDYYLPTATPLYHAGSRTAGDAGLFHYTTRVDQIKEGEELRDPWVNIGLHYIATTNGVPKDSDGDGIPDYVENWHGDGDYNSHTDTETDWQNPMTDGVTPDPSGLGYDTVDLDGDGLCGAAKRLLR